MCDSYEETFPHFRSCLSYGNPFIELDWQDIFGDDPEKQNTMAVEVNRRENIRKKKNKKKMVGLPPQLASLLQDTQIF